MKGKEIINYIHKDKMPDIRQVRERCIQQEEGRLENRRWLRFSTVAAALVAVLVLSTTVYAAAMLFNQRLDIGGPGEYIIMTAEEYDRWHDNENITFSRALYVGPSGLLRLANFFGDDYERVPYSWRLDSETTQWVNAMLESRIFTACGEPFQLMAPDSDGPDPTLYRADDRGYIIFCRDGNEIDTIRLSVTYDGRPRRLDIYKVGDLCDRFGYVNTQEEAMAVMSALRLPTVEGLRAPMFLVYDFPRYYWICGCCDTEREIHPAIRRGFVRYNHIGQARDSAFAITVVFVREDGENPHERPILDGSFREHVIAGTIIHEIIERGHSRFTWQYDGLVYTFLPLYWTLEQSMEAIRSMVE